MKTTKKGFTLIELIVVIAIIGVLAAILVPSMLGYVKKSKIQGANSTASTLLKAANSAATDIDEDDAIFPDGIYSIDNGTVSDAATSLYETDTAGYKKVKTASIAEVIEPFFNDIKKGNYAVGFKDGSCVVAAVRSGKYFGTSPAYYTAKNWDSNKPANAAAACAKVNTEKSLGVTGAGTTTT